MPEGAPAEVDAATLALVLERGELDIEGRLVDASNLACVAIARLDGVEVRCVYKPQAGERPLWDFPHETLSRREVAAYRVSDAAGWNLVPTTVWRSDGPAGPGMCQRWIEVDDAATLIDVVPRGVCPPGWQHVIDAEGARGRPVSLVHADTVELRAMAVFDAVVNNADRKGGHVLIDEDGAVFGIDHGVTFSEDDKLRTVLWGWAGEPLDAELTESLRHLEEALAQPSALGLDRLLHREEVLLTRTRVSELIAAGTVPHPGEGWPSLPWPAF